MTKSLFGCLASWQPAELKGYNGLRQANEDFLRAIVRYSSFDELHFYLIEHHINDFNDRWHVYLEKYGAGKTIKVLPVYQLPKSFQDYQYSVFHCGDPYLSDVASLREFHSDTMFPITGRAHSLSDDPRLSRVRDLILSPVKSCDSILCSSSAQKTVMKRLLAAASASFSDAMGVALPYRGQVDLIPLGCEPLSDERGERTIEETLALRSSLGIRAEGPVILCLGRLSPSDKMDLHPLLFALNDLQEEGRVDEFQLVIAGSGDASGEYIQSLLSQAYELNLEDQIRFELAVDQQRKERLFEVADVFVSLADNVQESFGLAPIEAMGHGLPVILSDWNGYRDLVEEGVSGYLIETVSADHDRLSRSISLLHNAHANFIQAQGVALSAGELTEALEKLLCNESLRDAVGLAAQLRVNELFSWSNLIGQYHELVSQLSEEASRIRHHHGREVGRPYSSIFGHYATEQLEKEMLVEATDRGIRVLLQSEKGFFFREISYLLSKDRIRDLLGRSIKPVSVSSLMGSDENNELTMFAVSWMLKYHLLAVASKVKGQQSSLSYKLDLLPVPKKDDLALNYPEQRRSVMLEPFVRSYLDISACYLSGIDASKGDLILSVSEGCIEWMDERLLQAISWFGEREGIEGYGEITKVLEKKGGAACLINEYSLWYRNGRKEFFHSLRVIKLLADRFKKDLSSINDYFWGESIPDATGLISLEFLSEKHGTPVIKLTLDNGQVLVYKSRNLAIDHYLMSSEGSITGAINQWLGDFPGIGAYKVLAPIDNVDSGYGYTEFIESQPITADNVDDYHRRLGVVTGFCLFTGLGDMHHQNIRVNGGVPFLIDVETALHGPVLMNLERELSNPDVAFIRGMDESSMAYTGLRHVWQSFHTNRVNFCSTKLVNGELIPAEPLNEVAVLNHFIDLGERHSLDGLAPSFASLGCDEFLEGFRKVVTVIAEHYGQWQTQLSGLKGLEARYQPRFNQNDSRKQLRDLYVSNAFQKVDPKRLDSYFGKMAKRLTTAGEVSQRWLDVEWHEPTGRLAGALSEGWLNMEQRGFAKILGQRQVFVRDGRGNRIGSDGEDFFAMDELQKAISLAEKLSSDSELLNRFLKGYCEMLTLWFTEQLTPGVSMSDELKKKILDKRGKS